ncbi:MAG: hypothetical protein R3B06_26455 [Kofleriaceae bacterium]
MFRDPKDLRFGLGLSATHIGTSARRDRLLLLTAIAHALSCDVTPSSARSLAPHEGMRQPQRFIDEDGLFHHGVMSTAAGKLTRGGPFGKRSGLAASSAAWRVEETSAGVSCAAKGCG